MSEQGRGFRVVEDGSDAEADVEQMTVEQAKRSAWSSECPPDRLVVFAGHRDAQVRAAAARNRNCTNELLQELAADRSVAVRAAVAGNARTAPDVRAMLLKDRSPTVLAALARRAELTAADIRLLAREGRPDILEGLAGQKELTSSLLLELAQTETARVRQRIAWRRDCPGAVLLTLAGDRSADVQAAVAKRRDCPSGAFEVLVDHAGPKVLAMVAGNTTAPPAVLARLADHSRTEIRRAVAWNSSTSAGTLEKLLVDRDAYVRTAAVGNRSLPLEALLPSACDGNAAVESRLAGWEGCPPELLSRFASRRKGADVRQAVARNPSTPAEALVRLASDPSPGVRGNVAANPVAPAEALEKLAEDVHFHVRRARESRLLETDRGPGHRIDAGVVASGLFAFEGVDEDLQRVAYDAGGRPGHAAGDVAPAFAVELIRGLRADAATRLASSLTAASAKACLQVETRKSVARELIGKPELATGDLYADCERIGVLTDLAQRELRARRLASQPRLIAVLLEAGHDWQDVFGSARWDFELEPLLPVARTGWPDADPADVALIAHTAIGALSPGIVAVRRQQGLDADVDEDLDTPPGLHVVPEDARLHGLTTPELYLLAASRHPTARVWFAADAIKFATGPLLELLAETGILEHVSDPEIVAVAAQRHPDSQPQLIAAWPGDLQVLTASLIVQYGSYHWRSAGMRTTVHPAGIRHLAREQELPVNLVQRHPEGGSLEDSDHPHLRAVAVAASTNEDELRDRLASVSSGAEVDGQLKAAVAELPADLRVAAFDLRPELFHARLRTYTQLDERNRITPEIFQRLAAAGERARSPWPLMFADWFFHLERPPIPPDVVAAGLATAPWALEHIADNQLDQLGVSVYRDLILLAGEAGIHCPVDDLAAAIQVLLEVGRVDPFRAIGELPVSTPDAFALALCRLPDELPEAHPGIMQHLAAISQWRDPVAIRRAVSSLTLRRLEGYSSSSDVVGRILAAVALDAGLDARSFSSFLDTTDRWIGPLGQLGEHWAEHHRSP